MIIDRKKMTETRNKTVNQRLLSQVDRKVDKVNEQVISWIAKKR